MASNYPTSLDIFSNPSGTDSLNSPSHSLQHSDINDAVEAIEAKLGIGASPAGSATAGQVLTAQGGGTAIWANAGGLTLLSTTTFSAVSSHSVSNFTDASYTHYKIVLVIQGSTGLNVNFKFRENVTDKSTGYYGAAFFYRFNSTSGLASARNNGSEAVIGATSSTPDYLAGELVMSKPTTERAFIYGKTYDANSNGGYDFAYVSGGATDITGFSLIPSTGTITGKVTIYGFRE